MASFILRNLDPIFWAKVRAKAELEGVTVYDLIVRLLSQWLVAAVLVGLSAGCGYKLPTEPTTIAVVPSVAPASIRLGLGTRGDHLVDITATVLTRDGHFVPGVLVSFAMDTGTVSPADATTNANGVAQAVATPTTTNATLTVSGGSLTATTTISAAPAGVQPTPSMPPPSVPLPAPFVQLQPITTTVGAATLFTIGTYMPGGTAIVRVEWTFGDGATSTTNSGTTSHTYTTAGSFTASVTATDTLGRSASNSAPVTVNAIPPPPPPPTPAPASLAASLTCTIAAHVAACNIAATYGGVTVPSTDITSVDWDLGNGHGETTVQPVAPVIGYTYPLAGTYLVVAGVHANVTIDGVFVPKTTTTSKSVVIP